MRKNKKSSRVKINWPRLLLVLSLLALCSSLGVVHRLRQENLRLVGIVEVLQAKSQGTKK